MKLRMLLFFLIVTAIIAAGCAYMAARSMSLWPVLQEHQVMVWGSAALFAVLQFGVPLLHRLCGIRSRLLYWCSYMALGLVSTYFLYLAAADLVQAILRAVFHLPAAVGTWALASAAVLTLVSGLVGLVQCLRPVRTVEVELPLPDLPVYLQGFRIIQISDLHLSPLLTRAPVQRLADQCNALAPDLIAVTGDLADGDIGQERLSLEALGTLRAAHGIYFVTGNHEYYSGVEPWLRAVRDLGWKVLMNEHAIIQHEGGSLAVIGLPDPTGRIEGHGPDLSKAMAGIPDECIRLLLNHQPLQTARAVGAGIHIQLSGHTHGGQYFPWSLVIRRFFEHPVGLYRVGSMWLYVSPGTGFWGPPNRFLVPPEITVITLRKAAKETIGPES
jgi:uncharacterized protein